jgi:hypothetical protein
MLAPPTQDRPVTGGGTFPVRERGRRALVYPNTGRSSGDPFTSRRASGILLLWWWVSFRTEPGRPEALYASHAQRRPHRHRSATSPAPRLSKSCGGSIAIRSGTPCWTGFEHECRKPEATDLESRCAAWGAASSDPTWLPAIFRLSGNRTAWIPHRTADTLCCQLTDRIGAAGSVPEATHVPTSAHS